MKVFEIAGPVFTRQVEEAPEKELTSGEDIVLSKNGEQAVRELKLSDQEVELLKAVALGWADMSDLGDLERDIFEYWFGNNPEDFNPDLHGGGADPSDTIMDELEGWFEDKSDDDKAFDVEFKAADDRIKRDALADSEIAVGEERDDSAPTIDDLARILKLSGIKSEGIKITPRPKAPTPPTDDFSKGGRFNPKPGFGDVEGTPKPTPNVDTFGSKFHTDKSPSWKNIDVKPTKTKSNVSKDIDR